jgi:hypothetical protein
MNFNTNATVIFSCRMILSKDRGNMGDEKTIKKECD